MKFRTWWSAIAVVVVAVGLALTGFAMSGGSSGASPTHRSVVPPACGRSQPAHAVSASPRVALSSGQVYSLCSRQIKGTERQRAASLHHH